MVLKRLVRSYFEQHGSFKGIENEFFYDKVKGKDLYEILGFNAVGSHTSEEVYNLNKDYVLGNLNAEEIKQLNAEGVLGKFPVHKGNPKEIPNVDLVKLVSHYLRYSKNKISVDGETAGTFMQFCIQFALLKDVADMEAAVKSDLVKNNLKALDIKWVKSDIPNCLINNGIIYYNRDLTVAERNVIIRNAVLDAFYNITELSISHRVELLNLVDENIIKLAELDIARYRAVLMLAVRAGKTVKELCEYAGLNYIDTIEQVKTMGCSVNLHTATSVKVFTINSTKDDFVILNNEDFKMLYERNLLNTIEWDNNLAIVMTPQPIKLCDLLLCRVDRDLRR